MDFSHSKDQSLLHLYESVRRQVEVDKSSGGRYRFVGETARQYAEHLREEMAGDACGLLQSIGRVDIRVSKKNIS